MPSSEPCYLLDNADPEAPARLSALSSMFDQATFRYLTERGVSAGWHCLEVGGGGGSIATWLADRVGPNGRVLATDIDTRHFEPRAKANLEVRRHDIVNEPLPEASYDLIHLRLVLNSIPEWRQVLHKLVAALKPGGWLVDEEFDSDAMPPNPARNRGEVLLPSYVAMARLMADHRFDRQFGRLGCTRFQEQGLTNVGAEARTLMVHGGSPGAALMRANLRQLRGALVDADYVTPDDVDADLERMLDPAFMMPSSTMWTTWGQRTIG